MRRPVWITVLWLALGGAALGISAFFQFVTLARGSYTTPIALSIAAALFALACAAACIRRSPLVLARLLAAAIGVIALVLVAESMRRLLNW